MTLPLWKRILCQESGWVDLDFYLAHDKELYFKGMVGAAVCSMAVFILGIILCLVYDAVGGIIIALIGVMMFSQIKMYLHTRKDNIEIKEMLRDK